MNMLKLALAVSAVAIVGQAYAVNPGNPATLAADANITVLTPLSIAETTKMTFPETSKPGVGQGPVSVTSTPAEFLVTGDSDEEYTFDASYATGACGGDLKVLFTRLDFVEDGVLIGGEETKTVTGHLDITEDATAGTYTCNYTVTAQY